MQIRKHIYSLCSILLLLTSCQRVIDIDIKSAPSLLVIEGNITNVTGSQTVVISNTVGYNDANVYPAVKGATVTITSNGVTTAFKETLPGWYTTTNFRGKVGQTYRLTVQTENKTYTADSQMPVAVNLDSLGVSSLSVGAKTVKTVSVFYRDLAGVDNQYHFVMYVNGVQVKQVFTISDNLTDGRIVNTMLYQDDIPLKTGDKVEVDMQCVDKNMYNYWYSLSQQGGNGPANSAAPSNPISNISNGALGYFSVHTTQRKSIFVL